jgi:hypothetical protein
MRNPKTIAPPASGPAYARSELVLTAEHLIDPAHGLHQLEWAQPDLCYRWTGRGATSRFLTPLDRSSNRHLTFNVLSYAEGTEASQVVCLIDGAESALTQVNANSLSTIVAKSDKKYVDIELRSQFVTEPGGQRNLGLALISLQFGRA